MSPELSRDSAAEPPDTTPGPAGPGHHDPPAGPGAVIPSGTCERCGSPVLVAGETVCTACQVEALRW